MSDWNLLNQYRVKEATHYTPEKYVSDNSFGFNGMFRIPHNGNTIRCVASDGMGWQHVSVTVEFDKRTPRWEVMCFVRDLFWDDGDWVIQFHPPKKEYVNFHPCCLHLWRYIGDGEFKQPTPDSILVGPMSRKP